MNNEGTRPQEHWVQSCVLAARPKTLPAAIVPVWVASVWAWQAQGWVDYRLAVVTVLGAIFIQIATNFFNDAIDARKGADTEKRLGPKRVTASGILSPRVVMGLGVAFLVLATWCGVLLYQACGWVIIAIGLPSLFLAYGYTGGPYPLAYRGMGEVFVILFFGVIAVMGTGYILTHEWTVQTLVLGLQVGFLSAILISINNIRDREEDSLTGKRTMAVRLGHERAVMVVAFEVVMVVLLGLCWVVIGHGMWALAGIPVAMIGFGLYRRLKQEIPGESYNRYLAISGLQLILFAVMMHMITYWTR